MSHQSPHCGLHRGLGSLTDRGNPRRTQSLGCVQTTGRSLGCVQTSSLSPPNPKPSRQLESAFPRIQQEKKKKKEEKGRWPWGGGTGRGSGTIQAELPIRRHALRGVHAGWVTQSVLVSWVFSSLRPALDSQPCSPSVATFSGVQGSGSAGEEPRRDPAVEGLPWHRRVLRILATSGLQGSKPLEISLPYPSRRAG